MDLDFLAHPLAQGFLLFLAVGFLAQLVDGALGMAYGVISSSVLIAFGVPPAQVSAMVHAAECFTTGASAVSHTAHRNIDWKLFFRLAPAGIIGGIAGAYLITGFDPTILKAVVIAYLGILGIWMLTRALRAMRAEPAEIKHAVPLGLAGGFLDASGGGGWGPVVTSTLLGRGHAPRFVIGSVNTSEFFVTVAISATFVWTFITGRFVLEGGLAGAAGGPGWPRARRADRGALGGLCDEDRAGAAAARWCGGPGGGALALAGHPIVAAAARKPGHRAADRLLRRQLTFKSKRDVYERRAKLPRFCLRSVAAPVVNSINSMLVNALFNQTADSAVSADLLAAWAKSKAGIGAPVADLTKDPNAPLAPVWTPGYTPGADVLAQRAFDGKGFFDLKAKLYSDLGATGDYQRLFALHTGLSTLNALAGQAENEKLTPAAKAKIVAQFERGLAELQSFFGKEKFDDIRLAQGDRVDAAQTTLALPTKSEDYVTPILHRGGLYDKISGLDANAKFDIVADVAGRDGAPRGHRSCANGLDVALAWQCA